MAKILAELQPNKKIIVDGWSGKEKAHEMIEKGIDFFKKSNKKQSSFCLS